MNIPDLAKQCVEQINLVGNDAQIALVLPGRWTKSGNKRLCPGGPLGRINGEDMTSQGTRLVVFFGAMDVLAFLTARGLIQAVGPDGQNLVSQVKE